MYEKIVTHQHSSSLTSMQSPRLRRILVQQGHQRYTAPPGAGTGPGPRFVDVTETVSYTHLTLPTIA